MPREPPAGADLCAVLLPAQQVWQGKARARDGGRSPALLGKEGPATPTTVLPLLQPFGEHIPAGEQR